MQDGDPIIKSENKIYQSIELNNLGWINCDAFYNKPTDNIFFTFNNNKSLTFVNTYVIFKNINSFMNVVTDKDKYTSTLNKTMMNLPLNEKVKIISVSYNNSKFYADSKEITISKKLSLEMNLKEVSEKDIEKFFKI